MVLELISMNNRLKQKRLGFEIAAGKNGRKGHVDHLSVVIYYMKYAGAFDDLERIKNERNLIQR